jgi:hypothetical protein
VETTLGRYDDVIGHLNEMREMGERLDKAWLTAPSRAVLGNLAIAQGRQDEARAC